MRRSSASRRGTTRATASPNMEGKDAFVEELQERALEWASRP
jgi:hypothetical protein